MDTLRITQTAEAENHFRVEIALLGDGLPLLSASARFDFDQPPQDQVDLRWYLEDYLQSPHDPAPIIAARIEQRMTEVGSRLFKDVFQASEQGRRLWARICEDLSNLRVEVISDVRAATTIPWELLYDPHTETRLALRAAAFVRAQHDTAVTPRVVDVEAGPIRILLVICRPSGGEDVPFRSVAGKLVKALSEETRAVFQLDVLRPPTFERLASVLREAKRQQKPYHVVHFDGHGMYADLSPDVPDQKLTDWLRDLIPLVFSGQPQGPHGYLLFENPATESNIQPVDGTSLGGLLRETDVPILVLNACRSAHAEPPPQPETAQSSDEVHAQVRAFGSLAQEVINAGATGVVAMRYNVYVVTAAQFVADLYSALVRGATFGEAVTFGRKQLAANPQRSIAYESRPLQDWCVPMVYEALPTQLFPQQSDDGPPMLSVRASDTIAGAGGLDPQLPKPPDAGFFGRDETLLALDRAFDSHSIVLLYAYAGSGKTTTSAEFARWYSLTGGVQGPVLFTSFEQYMPLPRVLDHLGEVFGTTLEQSGVNWLALDDDNRRDMALQVLTQIPVLWIWDNVEPVAGFPTGAESVWSDDEQRELADFLRDAAQTQANFLLTSRRVERHWLGDNLATPIAISPMPMQERVQLARALVEKKGHRLTEVDDWRPLLRFTKGNPLTITVLVGQALRDGLKTRDQIQAFVTQLRSGEAAFEDEADQGRSRSLGASLAYGFDTAFSDEERAQLACLHFFQGFVDVDALEMMGSTNADCSLPELRGLTREAWIALLDRAAEVGLLTSLGGGYYTIHPTLPWFFKGLFNLYYPPQSEGETTNPQIEVVGVFVSTLAVLGNHYQQQYENGNRDVIDILQAEEANLLHARRLARTQEWWDAIIATMQGLQTLYNHTGRWTEWSRLVKEIVPDFIDPDTDGPLPGREDYWSLVSQYRIRLARNARQLKQAERMQGTVVEWERRQNAAILKRKTDELDATERNSIRSLAVSLHDLGGIQREIGKRECVLAYEEALELNDRIGDQKGAVICTFNIGYAYKDIPGILDLNQSKKWFQRSLKRHDKHDRLGRAKCLNELGGVAYKYFQKARQEGASDKELQRHLNQALKRCNKALRLLPDNAITDLAAVHNRLGLLYWDAGQIDCALEHFPKSIHYNEMHDNLYRAAQARFNTALVLRDALRLADAWDYARAALENYKAYGIAATDDLQRTERLLAEIEADLNAD